MWEKKHTTWFITLDHWHLTPAAQAREGLPLAADDAEPTNQCAVGLNTLWQMCHVDLYHTGFSTSAFTSATMECHELDKISTKPNIVLEDLMDTEGITTYL